MASDNVLLECKKMIQFVPVKNWLLSCFLYHGMTFVSGHLKRLEFL